MFDTYPHYNRLHHDERSSYQSRNGDRDRCYTYLSPKPLLQYNPANHHYHNNTNTQHNAPNMSTLDTLELIGALQSQIIGLHLQSLQQALLNSINTFDGTKKAEFATWAQSIENAALICNLDPINITLSKLQGAPLKSAIYLEGKETCTGKKLSLITLKQHLTANYSVIPYDMHAINVYDTLQQGADEPTEAYLHRAQDILEHILHTNNMSEITAIGTNHAKILTGLKDRNYVVD